MHYDVAIIGAGMSGLAAGIRLAYYDNTVCILDRHALFGGLNSFYRRDGRCFDVGLHAMTNFAPAGSRSAPLSKLLRQLRLDRADFDLCPQYGSAIRFPGRTLRFTNDIAVLTGEVAGEFPREIDRFRRLIDEVRACDDTRLDAPYRSARKVLRESLRDPVLIDMLLCPLMFYGSAREADMDFTQFVTMFKAIFCEGLARPRAGVRAVLRALVKKYRSCGGRLRMNCGVRRIVTDGRRVTELVLDSGEVLEADTVFSSAGYVETMQMCSDRPAIDEAEAGKLSFVESIVVLDCPPADLGLNTATTFYNDSEVFTYAEPDALVDIRSGVICCPNNFERHEDVSEGVIRFTSPARYSCWRGLDDAEYARFKGECFERVVAHAAELGAVPEFREHLIYRDTFTPRTIHKYTGHVNGAVYGSPRKRRDGRTHLENLYLCGTDQGFLGIIGAMLSGISMANLHVLSDG